MKRFLVLALTLTLVMGFSTIMFAAVEPDCKPDPIPSPCLPKDKIITITATNPLQGEITLPASKNLGVFPCGDNKGLTGNVDVKIRSNGYLKVTLDLEQPFKLGDSKLATHAALNQYLGQNSVARLAVYHDWVFGPHTRPKSKLSDNYWMNDGKPNAIRNYSLVVQGKTGLIEAQPAGKYEAKVKITIAAL